MEEKKTTIQTEEAKKIPLEDRPEYQSIRNIIIGAKMRDPNLSDDHLEEELEAFGII